MKVQNYFIPASCFISKNITFNFNSQHKKIVVIVSIFLATIAACYLAARYLRIGVKDLMAGSTEEVEMKGLIPATSENLINWDALIEPLSTFQMNFFNFKELLSQSSISSCPYKKIYLVFCYTHSPHTVFEEDSKYYAHVSQLPCLPNEALLLYIPLDEAKSRQIENSFPILTDPFGLDKKMITHQEYRQSQRQGYLAANVVDRLFS